MYGQRITFKVPKISRSIFGNIDWIQHWALAQGMLNGRKFLIVAGCKEWDSEYWAGAETAADSSQAGIRLPVTWNLLITWSPALQGCLKNNFVTCQKILTMEEEITLLFSSWWIDEFFLYVMLNPKPNLRSVLRVCMYASTNVTSSICKEAILINSTKLQLL